MADRRTLDESPVPVEFTGKIMVVAVVVFIVVIIFVVFLHLYAKWFWHCRETDAAAAAADDDEIPSQRRRRSDIVSSQAESSSPSLRLGLDPSVLKFIPAVGFNPKKFKDGLECSVCLADVSEGDKTRFLPKCNHGFHVDCIDLWFKSHSTCPLCRNPISPQILPENPNGVSPEYPNYPTNVLFWGNQTQVSTLGPCLEEENQNFSTASSSSSARPDGMLVIDILGIEEEDSKSSVPTRLRSLRRLLSRDRRLGVSSSTAVNVEQVDRIPS